MSLTAEQWTAIRACDVLAAVRPGAARRDSPIHGEAHWQAVSRIGLALAAETPGADAEVAALFGILHDCRRVNDGHDPDHGRRAARVLDELRGTGLVALPAPAADRLREAIALHNDGLTSDDPVIGVCWDADRLCLPRVGIAPDDALLSTSAARAGREWSAPLLDAPLQSWRDALTTPPDAA